MNNGRVKNTTRNIIFGMANQLILLLLSFINRTIFIWILGVGYLGINSLFTDLLAMLSLADLGIGTAMVYSLYKPLAENKKDEIATLIAFYKKIYYFIALGIAVIGLVLFPFLDNIVKLDQEIPYLKGYYLFFLANSVLSYLFVYKTSLFIADQKNYIISKYQIIFNFGKILCQSVFLFTTQSYFIYLIIHICTTLINNLYLSIKANQLYPYINEPSHNIAVEKRKEIFRNIKSVFIYKLSGVLINSTDNMLISIFIGTIWVGFYSNYILVIHSLNNFINVLYTSVTASIGNVIVNEKPKIQFEIFQSLQTVSFIISTFASVCLYLLLNDLIRVWLGTKYLLDHYVFVAIIINFYLGNIVHCVWSFREASGLYMRTKYVMLIAAIINIILSIILGKIMGLSGILFATAIARLTTFFWYEPNLLFKEYFGESIGRYYIPVLKNIILTILLIIIFSSLMENIIINSWVSLLIKSFVVAFFTLVITIIPYARTKGFRMILNKVKGIR